MYWDRNNFDTTLPQTSEHLTTDEEQIIRKGDNDEFSNRFIHCEAKRTQ